MGKSTALTEAIIGYSMKIHREVGMGLDEFTYRNGLLYEFQKSSISYELEKHFDIRYENAVIGGRRIDLIVAGWLILELKAIPKLTIREELQLMTYLRLTGLDEGLLINFGAPSLEVKHKYRNKPPEEPPSLH